MKTRYVRCWLGGKERMNLGEWYCEMILHALGQEIRYKPKGDEPCLMIIGSEFRQGYVNRILKKQSEVLVWGVGNSWGPNHAVKAKKYPRVKFFGLRGPKTAEECELKKPVPLCDPGFLLSKLHNLPQNPSGEILYIPHWSERAHRVPGTIFCDVLGEREYAYKLLARIVNAEFVLTSAMHVMIACLSYGVPCAVHLPPNTIRNKPLKWADVFETIPPSVQTVQEGKDWYKTFDFQIPDTSAMLKVFPL